MELFVDSESLSGFLYATRSCSPVSMTGRCLVSIATVCPRLYNLLDELRLDSVDLKMFILRPSIKTGYEMGGGVVDSNSKEYCGVYLKLNFEF